MYSTSYMFGFLYQKVFESYGRFKNSFDIDIKTKF